MSQIPANKLVDRDDEAALLADMLWCTDGRRVLAVSDQRGMGKTDVLRKLRFICETKYEVPAAMLRFDDFEGRPDLFTIAHRLYSILRDFDTPFPRFEPLNEARGLGSVQGFQERLRSVYGSVDARGARVVGGQVAGSIFNIEADNVNITTSWNDQAETQAKNYCVDALTDDLVDAARQSPVVLLFDTVNKATEDLQHWLILNLIRRHVLTDAGNHKLIVVLAGLKLDDALAARLHEKYFEHIVCVEPGASVRKWSLDCIAEFLRVNDCGSLTQDQTAVIQQHFLAGGSLAHAILIAKGYLDMDAA